STFLHESTQPEALNYALDRDLVSGELVALIDGDCVAPKNWLRGLVHVLKEKAVDAVGGPGLTSPDAHGLERIVGMDLDSRFLSHPGGLVKRLPNMNLLLRRDILDVVRFPESWPVAYDEVFGYELNNKGYKLWFDPSSFVWHRHRSTVRRYVLQQVATAKQMARVRRESGRGLKGDNIVSGSMLLQPVVAALLIVTLLLA